MPDDAPTSDPEKDLPDWAKWLRRQLNGVNLVIGGLMLVAVAVLALKDKLPVGPAGPDCSDYSKLSKEEIEECQAQ